MFFKKRDRKKKRYSEDELQRYFKKKKNVFQIYTPIISDHL